jgi:hypothetical protein
VKSFIRCIPRQMCSKVVEDGIGRACGKPGGEKKCIQGFAEGM